MDKKMGRVSGGGKKKSWTPKPPKVDPDAPRNKKKARKERKAQTDRHFDLVEGGKNLWEKYRMKAVPVVEKRESIDKVLGLWKGHMKTLCARHDASRVIQSIFQFGTLAQQEKVMEELKGHILEMAKEKHAHNILEKVLKYGSPSMKAAVLREVKGNAARLMTHKMGILVLEAGYAKAWSGSDMWELLQEAYGPQYAHIKVTPAGQAPVAHLLGTGAVPPPGCADGGEDVATLPPAEGAGKGGVLAAKRSLDSLLQERPEERVSILRNLYHHITKFVTKGFLGTTIGQRLLADFLRVASPLSIRQVVPTITDAIVALVSSRDGLLAASIALAYATAKERKVVLGHIKSHVTELAVHDQGHMLLVKAMDCVDDTVQIGKAILKPLAGDVELVRDTACHRFGRRVWLHLLAPGSSRYFPRTDMQLLQPVWVPVQEEEEEEADGTAATGQRAAVRDMSALEPAGAEEGDGEAITTAVSKRKSASGPLDLSTLTWAPTSKKSAPIRRAQLLKIALPALRDACLVHTRAFMVDRWGSEVLLETVRCLVQQAATPGGVASPSDATQILEAVVEVVKEGDAEDDDVELPAASGAGQAASDVRGGVHFGGGDSDGEEEEEKEGKAAAPAPADDALPTLPLLETASATLLLKRLLVLEREDPSALGGFPFGEALWTAVKEGYPGEAGPGLDLVNANRGLFLLSDLCQAPGVGEAVKKALTSGPGETSLEEARDCAGKGILLQVLGLPGGKPARGTKRQGGGAARRGGKKPRR